MKTIFSTPEFKALDKAVKRVFPKHDLAILCDHCGFRFVAVKHYTGFIEHEFDNEKYELCDNANAYSLGAGTFLSLSNLCDINTNEVLPDFKDVYWYMYGLQASDRQVIIHLANSSIFKHNIQFFKLMFNAICKENAYHYKYHRFVSLGMKAKDRYDNNMPIAFYTIKKDGGVESFNLMFDLYNGDEI